MKRGRWLVVRGSADFPASFGGWLAALQQWPRPRQDARTDPSHATSCPDSDFVVDQTPHHCDVAVLCRRDHVTTVQVNTSSKHCPLCYMLCNTSHVRVPKGAAPGDVCEYTSRLTMQGMGTPEERERETVSEK